MRPEVLIVSGYSTLVVLASLGMHRLGRASRVAWHTRPLAANRRAVPREDWPDADEADWPHSEIPRLHTAMAMVAVSAATLLPLAALVFLDRTVDALLLVLSASFGLGVLGWLAQVWDEPRTRGGEQRSEQPGPGLRGEDDPHG